MKVFPALSAFAVTALLSACASVQPPESPTPPPVTAPPPPEAMPAPVTAPSAPPPVAAKTYRPGAGIIESATVVALGSSSASAGGGASGPTMAYRLKMLDGTMQSVVQVGPRLNIGDRVEVTKEGRVIRP